MSVYRVGGNKSSQNVFPSVRPTLDLDFANSKTLDPRITFTRSSGGSYVGADGLIKYAGVNEARFDHDPVTGESLGLLVEESRNNLVLYSEEFDFNTGNSFNSWSRPGSGVIVIPNIITSPDGNQTADFVDNVGQVVSLVESARSVTPSSTTDYYATVYAKKGTSNGFTFNCYYAGNTEDNVTFNFSSGLVSGVPNPGEYIFQNVGNGWYKCGFRISRDSTGTRNTLLFRFWPSIRTQRSGGTYFWGAQLEVGAFPTSYIPTQASTRTRAADNASITGKNFSEWYRQDEGTIFAKGKSSSDTDTSTNIRSGIVWLAPLAATLRGIYLTTRKDGNNQIDLAVRDDDGTTSLSTNHILTSGYKVAGSYDKNLGILRFSLDGEPTKIFNQPTLLGFNTTQASLVIGSGVPFGNNSTTRKPNSTISKITYYPRALTPSQIQALTR
jgi:hypothetical protein